MELTKLENKDSVLNYMYGPNSFSIEFGSTWNCQLNVIAGIEDFLEELDNYSEQISFKELVEEVVKTTGRPLFLCDVSDLKHNTLEEVCPYSIIGHTPYLSSNGNDRHIVIFNSNLTK